MTAVDPSNANTILLMAHTRPKTARPAPWFVLSLILLAAGLAAWAMHFVTIGVFLLVGSSLFLIGALEETGTITTFDFTRRQVTIGKIGIFRTTITQTLPFDVIQDLSLEPEGCGAVLRLKDGTSHKATDVPMNYIRLNNLAADIRVRLGIAAGPPARPNTTAGRDIPPTPNGGVTLAASHRPWRGRSALGLILAGALVYLPTALLLSSPGPLPTTTGKISLVLMLLLINLPLFAFSFFTLFGRTPKLLLDPTTRHAHFDWSWPSIWPRETISFDDFAATGVRERMADRHGGRSWHPYIRLVSGRHIDLLYFSDGFRAAEDIAFVICRMTGAEFRNMS
jgi:hypothetical protein